MLLISLNLLAMKSIWMRWDWVILLVLFKFIIVLSLSFLNTWDAQRVFDIFFPQNSPQLLLHAFSLSLGIRH